MAIQERVPDSTPALLTEDGTRRYELPTEVFSGLGAVSIRHSWSSLDYEGNERQHFSLVIPAEFTNHRMIYSPPANTDTDQARLSTKTGHTANLLGWGENIETRIVRRTHETMTHELPEDHIFTHETPGIDCDSKERESRLNQERYTTDVMAEDNFQLFSNLHKENVIATGTSMGSLILAKMAYKNPRRGKDRININGLVFLAPAILTPNECQDKMGPRFISHMAHDVSADIAKSCLNLLTSRNPHKLIDLGDNLLHSMPSPSELRALRAQAISLKKGIDYQIIEAVARRYPIRAISGRDDPLQAQHLQEMSQNGYGKNLRYDTVPGGHDITIFPELRARLISDSVRELRLKDSRPKR